MMRLLNIVALPMILAGVLANTAHAEDYWAACTACGSGTQSFALGVPDDIWGTHIVNVYDDDGDTLRSFHVFIYYDHEFRAWSRFALERAPSLAALETVAAVKDASAFMAEVGDLVGPIDIGVPSVQDYLLARGALDAQVADRLLNATDQRGLLQRLLNATALAATTAGRVIAKRNVESTFRVVFEDGSSMFVTAQFLANNVSHPIIVYVEGSARLPDGTLLPETNDDINDLRVATDNPDTINALRHWVATFGVRGFRQTVGLPGGLSYSYLFTCDEDECVLVVAESR